LALELAIGRPDLRPEEGRQEASVTPQTTMRAWRTHEYGQPRDVLKLDEVEIPEPGEGELRIRALGIPLNLNDLERITGGNMMVRPELPYSPGMEVMGVVDACGPGAESMQDKRVVAVTRLAHGGFAEYSICPAVSAFEMPDDIPLPDAAALFFPFHLAWLGLFDRAELRSGETVLVHAAAGGAGSAAVQLAVDAGAHVIATVGSDDKVQLCRDLGAETVINYRTDDFAKIVMDQTSNTGVEVVFDNVGEAVMADSMNCLAYNGRYVMMGFASNKLVADEKFIVPRRIAAGNFKLCGVLLSYADAERSTMVKQAMGWNFPSNELGAEINRQIIDLVRAKRIRPVVGRVVAFEDVLSAVEAMANRETVGRTIVQLYDD
jgi:NADPH2:quinone reductase